MKNTLIVCSSNRLTERATSSCLKRAVLAGAALVEQTDTSDVSMARNLALTLALEIVQNSRQYDVVLMVDDDMVFTTENAQDLVSYARQNGVPTSGCYLLPPDGRIAAESFNARQGRWLTGLGFLAIPVLELKLLAAKSTRFKQTKASTKHTIEFTRSAAELAPDGEFYWEPEDYRLTRKLGGVVLLPIAVGHVKKQILMPEESQLTRMIAEGSL